MGQITMVNQGQADIVAAYVNSVLTPTVPNHTGIHLFQNNLIPQFNTVLADFVEADFVGYSAVNLDAWDFALNSEGFWEAHPTTAPAVFTAGVLLGPQTIYGYWVQTVGPSLEFCERFDVPIIVAADGQYISIFPRWVPASLAGTGNIND